MSSFRYSVLILVFVIWMLQGCAGVKLKFWESAESPAFVTAERDVPAPEVTKEAEIEGIRQTLRQLRQTLEHISASRRQTAVVVFSEPIKVTPDDTLGKVLSAVYKVEFDPPSLASVPFGKEITFETNVELLQYIEDTMGFHAEETPYGLKISKLKSVEYDISFIEKPVVEDVQELLHDPNATVFVYEKLGKMVVTDDIVGIRKIEEYLSQLKDRLLVAYTYHVRIDVAGIKRVALAGEITPLAPVLFAGSGQMSVTVKGERMLVRFRHVEFPSTVVFFLPSDGGTYTAREGDRRLRISLRREPVEWTRSRL